LEFDSGGARRRLSGPVRCTYWTKKSKCSGNRVIELVKVQWTCYGPEDATWEHEDAMQAEYPQLFEEF
jgi:hypothetical protein